MAARAASLIQRVRHLHKHDTCLKSFAQEPSLAGNREIIERVATVLVKAGLMAVAGELYEKACRDQLMLRVAISLVVLVSRQTDVHLQTGQFDKALEAYRKGGVFRKAVDLSRSHFPAQVWLCVDALYLRAYVMFCL